MKLEEIYKEFHKPLMVFIIKRVSNPNIAEDIAQDVFMKIAASITSLKEEEKIRSWIYNITRNAIIDYYRTKKPTTVLPGELVDDNQLENHDLSKELSACIRPMINQLPNKYKEAIELTELQGMSQKDLSRHLGMSFSGAKSRVQRGRLKLKELLIACCHIEADSYGNIIDFHKEINVSGDSCKQSNDCACN
ncbi:RNA polymerase sigma factor SigZ [Alkalihalobacillus sp. LMS39]|uniref:RNA polymerase sigma factor SigZ n=1 Tax=Alkalihalobacillus sp. LMS39 TaxID=2924032 RepID=UPI001FB48FBB|nr:RNA polymerase sigma factor SigZ [Alkalihalobacillus sp. LMS39]UOE95140.1 RNA polymerase sigma factor SigZ [Alkalihalobacillus sp. LMS39]